MRRACCHPRSGTQGQRETTRRGAERLRPGLKVRQGSEALSTCWRDRWSLCEADTDARRCRSQGDQALHTPAKEPGFSPRQAWSPHNKQWVSYKPNGGKHTSRREQTSTGLVTKCCQHDRPALQCDPRPVDQLLSPSSECPTLRPGNRPRFCSRNTGTSSELRFHH